MQEVAIFADVEILVNKVKEEERTFKNGDTKTRGGDMHLFLRQRGQNLPPKTSKHFWSICIVDEVFFWKADLAHVLLWSPVEGTLHRTVPNTHRRRKQLMPDCYAPLCHYSITEGHSFTITVGLWAPADWRSSRSVSSRWDSRQEFLACTSAFQPFLTFPIITLI